MSAQQVPGGPTQEEVARFAKPNPATAVSYKYALTQPGDKAKTNEFPTVPFAPDNYDTIADIKATVGADDSLGFGKKWMVPFTDADAAYIQRKQAAVQNANYERWLWTQYDTNDPAQSWIFQQVAPEQFEKRKQFILYQQNLATKYALLRLYGVKTEDDLMLKYLVETGQVELPKGPIWDPQKWMAEQLGETDAEYKNPDYAPYWQMRYNMGLFNPMRLFNEKQVPREGSQKQDPLVPGREKIQPFVYQGSKAPIPERFPGVGYLDARLFANDNIYALHADNAGSYM